jgi:hypothetical membrane protein
MRTLWRSLGVDTPFLSMSRKKKSLKLPPFPAISSLLGALFCGVVGLFLDPHETFWVVFKVVFLIVAFGYVVIALIALIAARRGAASGTHTGES